MPVRLPRRPPQGRAQISSSRCHHAREQCRGMRDKISDLKTAKGETVSASALRFRVLMSRFDSAVERHAKGRTPWAAITVTLWQHSLPPALQLLQSGENLSPHSKRLSSVPVAMKLHASLVVRPPSVPCHLRLSPTALLSDSCNQLAGNNASCPGSFFILCLNPQLASRNIRDMY